MTHADASELAAYYAARAAEYERIYDKPERQADLAKLRAMIPRYFAGRRVFEIACGTGYWTQHIAEAAQSVTATDINAETLAIAKSKRYPPGRVTFEIADVWRLPPSYRDYTGAFAGFWWSHVRRAERGAFFDALHRALAPGAVVVLLDNRYLEGSSTPISHVDEAGDAYQRRRLDDGSEHVVLKNFPTRAELLADLAESGASAEYIELDYYWVLKYEVAG
jgi:SAM-dependent methyltransferase